LVTYLHLVEGVVIGFHGVVEGQLDYELIRGYKLPCVECPGEIHMIGNKKLFLIIFYSSLIKLDEEFLFLFNLKSWEVRALDGEPEDQGLTYLL